MPLPPGLSPKDADQVLRAVMDDSNNRLRVDAEITAVVTDLEIRASSGDNIAITNQDGINTLRVETDGSVNTNTTIVGGELAVEISAADGDNIAIADPGSGNMLVVDSDGSINVDINGLDTFQSSRYTVGTSAIQITTSPLPNRSSVGLKAICTGYTDAIYVGHNSSVSSLNGWPLFNNDALELDLKGSQPIWVVASSSGQFLYVIELGE